MTYGMRTNNSTLLHSACAIVFVLFVFFYLYSFQADLLFMVQHVLSEGTTHYDTLIGSVVITLILYLVHVGARRISDFGDRLYWLTFFPSLLLLTALTGVDSGFTSIPFNGFWLWLTPLLLGVYVCLSLLFKSMGSGRTATNDIFVGLLWKNLLPMACMFIAVCMCSNSNQTFHYRLRVEKLLSSGCYSAALQVGKDAYDTDKSLTMLRIYALSKSKLLGEELFEYPLEGGSDALLPDGKDVRCLFYPEERIVKSLSIRKKGVMKPMGYLAYIERNGLAMRPATDYILCGYLLDKNLDGFVNEVRRRYNLSSPSLPKHYREALTLYTHLRSNPILVFHNEVMDADYADFQKLVRKYSNAEERESHVRDSHGGTYWFYYFYHKNKS